MTREEIIETIFANMHSMHRSSASKFHALIGQHDISQSQLEVLLTLKHCESITVKELAASMRLTPGAITQLVESLVRTGYVQREHDTTDRRVSNISLASGGTKKLAELRHTRLIIMRKTMRNLSVEELQVMLRVQQKMFSAIEELTATKNTREIE